MKAGTEVIKRAEKIALKSLSMIDVKRLVKHFTYRIEPKAEGGFTAHASDPSLPALEAPTREELQQKIQANIAGALANEFPSLKLPLEKNEVNFAFHIEHKPDGGLILQSTDGKELPIVGSTHAEIESKLAERVLGVLGKEIAPELSEALAGKLGSGDVKVVVKRNVTFRSSLSKPSSGDPSATPNLLSTSDSPILPEPSRTWPLVRFLLAALVLTAIFYFLRHR